MADSPHTEDSPDWQYDEFRQVGLDFESLSQVAAYDARQGDLGIYFDKLLDRLGVKQGHVLIDVGAGTAKLARAAAARGAEAHAVDISKAMLSHAEASMASAGANGVVFHHAGFLSFECQAETADWVMSFNALHHLPEFWKQVAIERMASWLKPGANLVLRDVIFSFDQANYREGIEHWISQVAGDGATGWSRADFEAHVRDEYSTYAWIIEGMMARAGFEIVSKDTSLGAYAEYVARKGDK